MAVRCLTRLVFAFTIAARAMRVQLKSGSNPWSMLAAHSRALFSPQPPAIPSPPRFDSPVSPSPVEKPAVSSRGQVAQRAPDPVAPAFNLGPAVRRQKRLAAPSRGQIVKRAPDLVSREQASATLEAAARYQIQAVAVKELVEIKRTSSALIKALNAYTQKLQDSGTIDCFWKGAELLVSRIVKEGAKLLAAALPLACVLMNPDAGCVESESFANLPPCLANFLGLSAPCVSLIMIYIQSSRAGAGKVFRSPLPTFA